ncbi:hypothetical protein [Nostoc sp. NZL]|nr:hypothetical protein [Nostoc sp. NZL]
MGIENTIFESAIAPSKPVRTILLSYPVVDECVACLSPGIRERLF